MTAFQGWFHTEFEDEDPHEFTVEVQAPNEQAAFAQASQTAVFAGLNCQVEFGDDAKSGVIKFGVGELESSIIV